MLESTIQKKGVPGEGIPTEQDMETINKFTRRKLTAQEVYVFPVVLCDNEIDRDGERFTTRALHTLSGLFVGKTGIFDHNPKGHNQTARIFETAVEEDPERTTCAGEPYRRLKARAYMVRTKANADLILEIDGGIKKEVSVGCAVAKSACSVCGKDPRHDPCGHRPGETYGEVKCCVELDEPTDAYEWSFVAVPAQVGAGVVKSYREREGVLPPRSREEVLAAVEKGAAYLVEEGNTRKYVPVPVEEFCKNRIRRMEEARQWLKIHVPSEKTHVEGYITIEGARNILDKMRNLLDKVEQRVYISCTRNYLLLLVRELEELKRAGKKVVIVTDQPVTFSGAKVYVGKSRGMQIGVIADSRYVLTGEYGEGSMNTCLYSGQKNFVELYKTALGNEIKLLTIQEEKNKA